MIDLLKDLEEYFGDRADLDKHDHPNEEVYLLARVHSLKVQLENAKP